jgi:rifampicin phosphotransferase
VLSVNEHGADYFLPNIAISITHSTLYRLLHRLLQMGFGADAANSLFDRLMAYCETKTGTINKELFELATMIRSRPELEKIVNERSSRDIIGSENAGPFSGISSAAGEISSRPRAP